MFFIQKIYLCALPSFINATSSQTPGPTPPGLPALPAQVHGEWWRPWKPGSQSRRANEKEVSRALAAGHRQREGRGSPQWRPQPSSPHAPKPQELPERAFWKASTAPVNGWLRKARNTADGASVRGGQRGQWGRPAEHPQWPPVCNPAAWPGPALHPDMSAHGSSV